MGSAYPIPLSVVAIELLGSSILLIGFRITVRSVYERFQTARPAPVVIFGAGEAGIITKQAVERPSADTLKVVAFLDDDPVKQGKRIDGAPIHSADDVKRVLTEFGANASSSPFNTYPRSAKPRSSMPHWTWVCA